MVSKSILLLGDPNLRESCSTITNFNNPELKQEIGGLKEALDNFRTQNGFGRGIAAIQIGIMKRMIALNLGKETFVIMNPGSIHFSSHVRTANALNR